MRQCAYCGFFNNDQAVDCQKCRNPLPAIRAVRQKLFWVGPQKAHDIRKKAMAAAVLGLLLRVYWGGYGPWTVIDDPTLAHLRTYLEPLLIYGGAALYLLGWILSGV